MKIDNVPFLNMEQRRRLGKKLKLSPTANGFMDLGEGVPVSDAFVVAMLLEKRTGTPTQKIMPVFEEVLFGSQKGVASNGHTVIVQKWTEYERGEGQRPDGYSLHLTKTDLKAFIRSQYKGLPRDHVPDYYVRTSGDPYNAEVDEATFKIVRRRKWKHGVRFFENNYPGSGGKSGWVKIPGGGLGLLD
jgi:hypothetical protein